MTQSDFHIDLVFVIDVTGSMRKVLDYVKSTALTFHADLLDAMGLAGQEVDQLRVKVIAYRDFSDPRHPALEESAFFTLPDEAEPFAHFVENLTPQGGRDDPESGLEGLAAAMRSEWGSGGGHRRHVIALFTDSSSHSLGHGHRLERTWPQNERDLTDAWKGEGGMDPSAKRLLIFAPPVEPWIEIVDDWAWDQVVHFVSKSGYGLSDSTFEQILATIANSVR